MPELAPISEPELTPSQTDHRTGKYLLFHLGHGEFGVPIDKVREVLEMQNVTRVPGAPVFVAGVINLRGRVVPVIDLRLTFGISAIGSTQQTCIVAVRVTLASSERLLGIVVDAVTEVVQLDGPEFLLLEEFLPVSEFGTRDPAPYLLGVARLNGKLKLILNIDEVLNNLDLRQIPNLAAAA